MNKPPLSVGAFGDLVAELHDSLAHRGMPVSRAEVVRRFFGPETRAALLTFQQTNRLPTTGVLDPVTDHALTHTAPREDPELHGAGAALGPMSTSPKLAAPKLGAPNPDAPKVETPGAIAAGSDASDYLVRGQVLYRYGLPLAGIPVRAFHRELRSDLLLAASTTDANGNFELWYSNQSIPGSGQSRANIVVCAYRADATGKDELLAESAMLFEAQNVEKVRIRVEGGPEDVWSEYDQVSAEITPLLGTLPASDLGEDAEHQDVTFLAGRTGQPVARVAAFALAHKQAAATGLSPAVLYGLARAGMPSTVPGLLGTAPERLASAFAGAVAQRLIPGTTDPAAFQGELRKAALGTMAESSPMGSVVGTVLADPAHRAALFERYLAREGDAEAFWSDVAGDPALGPKVADLQFACQMGALTGNHLPVVAELQRRRVAGELPNARALARLDRAAWRDIVTRSTASGALPSGFAEAAGVGADAYAGALQSAVAAAFPTETFAARAVSDTSATGPSGELRTFFQKVLDVDSGFDLATSDLDAALVAKLSLPAGTEIARLKQEIAPLKRLFRLSASYDQVFALHGAGLGSAGAIARIDEASFVRQFGGALGNALHLHRTAQHVAATALTLFAQHSRAFDRMELRAIASPDWGGSPALETMFGSLDTCACEHCASIHGPAAYLAEVLAFLGDRETGSRTALDVLMDRRPDLAHIELDCGNTLTPLPYIDLVNELLEETIAPFEPFALDKASITALDTRNLPASAPAAFGARGLELGSAPGVVVGEPKKRWAIAAGAWSYSIETNASGVPRVTGAWPQTSGTSAELLANPEHVKPAAYARLRGAVHPWSLPLDLWWEQVRVGLEHLGTSRVQLLTDLQPEGSVNPRRIAAELLGMTGVDLDLVCGGRPARVATLVPLASLTDLPVVDGVSLLAGDHVLVAAQADAAENGLYEAGMGAWQRRTEPGELAVVGIRAGSRAGSRWGLLPDDRGLIAVAELSTQAYWGLKATSNPVVELAPVRATMRQAGLGYEELIEVLSTRFVNPDASMRVVSDDPKDVATCDTAHLVIQPLSLAALDRIHRFVRLWRRLAWPAATLDAAITALGGDLDEALLVKLAAFLRVQARLGVSVESLLVLWANLDTRGGSSEYHRLFLNPELVKPLDPAFVLSAAGEPAPEAITVHAATVLAGMGIGAEDLADLISSETPLPAGKVTDQLSLASLSAIRRLSLLAAALGMTVEEIRAAWRITGMKPFTPGDPQSTLDFLEVVDRVAASGFTFAELDWLLAHQDSTVAPVGPEASVVEEALDGLRVALRQVQDDTTFRPDPSGDALKKRLAALGWPTEAVQAAHAGLSSDTAYAVPLTALPLGVAEAELPTCLVFDVDAAQLRSRGPLTPKDRDDARAVSLDVGWLATVELLYQEPRQRLAQALKAYELPTVRAPLAKLPGTVVLPVELRGRLSFDVTKSELTLSGGLGESERLGLLALADGVADLTEKAAWETAIGSLVAQVRAWAPPLALRLFTSAEVEDLLAAGADGERYAVRDPARYELVLQRVLVWLRARDGRAAVLRRLAEAVALEIGTVEILLTGPLRAAADPARPAIDDLLASGFADVDPGVATTVARFPGPAASFLRLYKASLILGRLRIPRAQLTWMAAGVTPRRSGAATVGWLDWGALPVDAKDDGGALFGAWLRVLDVCELRDALPRGEAGLGTLLAALRALVSGGGTLSDACAALATATGWDRAALEALAGPTMHGHASAAGLLDERALLRLAQALRRLDRLGASPVQALTWTRAQLTEADATSARRVVKAKYSEEEWPAVARPLQDRLRKRQRDALVAWLLPRPDPTRGQNWQTVDDLYAHLLIDVQMDCCFLTSRIKQAMSSVQLFVQRALMNLEAGNGVKADIEADFGWTYWKQMKSYRVWEADRKIFLYPENWIEPELRDDKSPFFQELEGALLQNEVNAETAQDALQVYLEKLDGVARLEVAGMYEEERSGGQPDLLHVFGRSHGTPAKYWYRQRPTAGRWTAWEPVDLDIGEAQILPIVWNGRLYLFWAIFTVAARAEKSTSSSPPANPPPPVEHYQMELAWSERKRGKWLTRRVTPFKIDVPEWFYPTKNTNYSKDRLALRAETVGGQLVIWYEYDDPSHEIVEPPAHKYDVERHRRDVETKSQGFKFTGCNGQVVKIDHAVRGVYQPEWTTVEGMFFASGSGTVGSLDYDESHHYYNSKGASLGLNLPDRPDGADALVLKRKHGKFRLLYAHQDEWINGRRELFYQDERSTFLVRPERVKKLVFSWKNPKLLDFDSVQAVQEAFLTPAALKLSTSVGSKKVTNPEILGAGPGEGAMITAAPMGVAAKAAVETSLLKKSVATKLIVKGDKEKLGVSEYLDSARINPAVKTFLFQSTAFKYTFETWYHPYVCSFLKTLGWKGIEGLMARQTQLQHAPAGAFSAAYQPTSLANTQQLPIEDVDFSSGGAYSQYNWELFFHAPFLIACRLTQNQRFEEAQRWFHFIFDPTDASKHPIPNRYWRTRPFYEQTKDGYAAQRIDRIIAMLAEGKPDPELDLQVTEWRNNPFKPFAVARARPVAFQKAVVKKYLDNLIAWGDQLFRKDTIESINEATQLYVLAAEILGPRPITMPPRAKPVVHTFATLRPTFRALGNALAEIELKVTPIRPDAVVPGAEVGPAALPPVSYFCVPGNDKLEAYWDLVAERLFNIRHCRNIEGVERQLALFEPPIDPALLVKAAASGMDISTAIADVTAAASHYRFNVWIQKATELCTEVKSLGAQLLAALEKKDGEEMALLRARHETATLTAMKEVKKRQCDEATQNLKALREGRKAAEARYVYYQKLLGNTSAQVPAERAVIREVSASASAKTRTDSGVRMTDFEKEELDAAAEAASSADTASLWEMAATLSYYIPNFSVDAKPWGLGAGTQYGGTNVGAALSAVAGQYRAASARHSADAGRSSKLGSLALRENDWALQCNLAAHEIMHIDQQVLAAEVRQDISNRELANHEGQIERSREIEDTLKDKYTNQELYAWMVGRVSSVYFQAYQMAYDVAKRAERAMRFEVGITDTSYIQFGYWDSLRRGLLAGEQLHHDVKRLELAYLDLNRREHELTKHVSLANLDPRALASLQETGSCFFNLPEAIFDLDAPGHYRRRIKSVTLTIPCVVGPYISINARLTLLSNRTRVQTTLKPAYPWKDANDTRFAYNVGAIESIVTSTAREDGGLFEVNLRDERYLPFEGAGAVSSWRLELPSVPGKGRLLRQFDYGSITDAVVTLRYTAADGGELLRKAATDDLLSALKSTKVDENRMLLLQGFSVRHAFPDAWYRFLHPAEGDPAAPTLALSIDRTMFPVHLQDRKIQVSKVAVVLRPMKDADYGPSDALTVSLKPPTGATQTTTLARNAQVMGGAPAGLASFAPAVTVTDAPGTWTLSVSSIPTALMLATFGGGPERLNPEAVAELGLILQYTAT